VPRVARAAHCYEAAAAFRDRCLSGNTSLLWPTVSVWTPPNLENLWDAFWGHPDTGEGTFFEKWEKQLAGCGPDVHRLAADAIAFYSLFPSNISAETKLDYINRVVSWKLGDQRPDLAHWSKIFEEHVGSAGMAYIAHRPRQLAFFFSFARAVKAERLDVSNPGVCAKAADRIRDEIGKCASGRNVLLHMLFPDAFEPTASDDHKQQIIAAFPELAGDQEDTDQALRSIRASLSKEYGPDFSFYAKPLYGRWHADTSQSEATPAAAALEAGSPEIGRQVWLVAPGSNARDWEAQYKEGIIAIGWDELGNLAQYQDQAAIAERLQQPGGPEPINDALACWEFARIIKPGDEVVAKRGRRSIVGYGVIASDYVHDVNRPSMQHVRKVRWLKKGEWQVSSLLPMKTLTEVGRYEDLSKEIHTVLGIGAVPPVGPLVEVTQTAVVSKPYGLAQAVAETFLVSADLSRYTEQLRSRKNLVFQGPPGVGKTFVARIVAQLLTGTSDPSFFEVVQFHQSYGYEDFVQGLRPSSGGSFVLQDGIFLRFCERARKAPARPFALIIDEINRGNLSKIFGELLLGLEPDKRGDQWSVRLAYSPDRLFSVPANVHVIGTMNTADRSLALVDYALRRRFAFVTLDPLFGHEGLRRFLDGTLRVPLKLRQLIEVRLKALNQRISEDRRHLGPGYQVGHSYFCRGAALFDESWYREVVDLEIRPLLEEYWFDSPEKAEAAVKELLEGI
jgi:5-methylcytosine-specific restriction protein B